MRKFHCPGCGLGTIEPIEGLENEYECPDCGWAGVIDQIV